MPVQCAATKVMTAQPKRMAPSMAKMGATPNADLRDTRSARMALAPASPTQPAVCQRARSRSTLWRYQDMGLRPSPHIPAPGQALIDRCSKSSRMHFGRKHEPAPSPGSPLLIRRWLTPGAADNPLGSAHASPCEINELAGHQRGWPHTGVSPEQWGYPRRVRKVGTERA